MLEIKNHGKVLLPSWNLPRPSPRGETGWDGEGAEKVLKGRKKNQKPQRELVLAITRKVLCDKVSVGSLQSCPSFSLPWNADNGTAAWAQQRAVTATGALEGPETVTSRCNLCS